MEMERVDKVENALKYLWTILSFIIPLVGIVLYFVHNKKSEAKIYGFIGVIGILVYTLVGIGFI